MFAECRDNVCLIDNATIAADDFAEWVDYVTADDSLDAQLDEFHELDKWKGKRRPTEMVNDLYAFLTVERAHQRFMRDVESGRIVER